MLQSSTIRARRSRRRSRRNSLAQSRIAAPDLRQRSLRLPTWLAAAGMRGKRFLTRPLTLLLVPPRGTQVKSFKLPLWIATAGGLMVSTLLIVTVFSCVHAVRMQGELVELARLRQVNEEQGIQLQALQQEAEEEQATFQDIKILEQKVRAMVGLSGSNQASRSEPAGGNVQRRAMLLGMGAASKPKPSAAAVSAILDETLQDGASTKQALELLEKDLDAHFKALAAMPDHWPVSGRITSTFGYRSNPFGGRMSEFHSGLDIAAPYGTQVTAAGAGTVIFVGYKAGYGRVIVIDHGNGYQTSYCHLSASLTSNGKKVNKGEAIGRVGSSGRSTGAHLHFGVTLKGALVDPRPLLK
jgi:murein DD-endopeptidase MepM/ murein hydrolase activator NlpD